MHVELFTVNCHSLPLCNTLFPAPHHIFTSPTQQIVDLEANEASTDKDLLKAISTKAEKIITTLKGLIPEGASQLTEAIIKENVGNEVTQQWLARVAIAEGLL